MRYARLAGTSTATITKKAPARKNAACAVAAATPDLQYVFSYTCNLLLSGSSHNTSADTMASTPRVSRRMIIMFFKS